MKKKSLMITAMLFATTLVAQKIDSTKAIDFSKDFWTENSGEIFTNYNVGIGVENPSFKLHVGGRMQLNDANNGTGIWYQGRNNDDWFVGLNSANQFRFRRGNNKFIIDQNGRVGIGTDAPSTSLDVKGDILCNNINLSGTRIHSKGNLVSVIDFEELSRIEFEKIEGSASNSGIFNLKLTNGIKVYNPITIKNGNTYFNSPSRNAMTISDMDIHINNAEKGVVSFNTSTENAMTISDEGVVLNTTLNGISADFNQLEATTLNSRHTYGSDMFLKTRLAFNNDEGLTKFSLYYLGDELYFTASPDLTDPSYKFNSKIFAEGYYLENGEEFKQGFWDKDDNQNISYTSGNVTIGTLATSNNLSVYGKISATEIEVVNFTDGPQSDYVFESDYELRSLEEVEQFVKTNKHLPEVPSAAEFKENGYSVCEMDDILLRKIEELTLYMIQMKKENEELKQRIEQLEN